MRVALNVTEDAGQAGQKIILYSWKSLGISDSGSLEYLESGTYFHLLLNLTNPSSKALWNFVHAACTDGISIDRRIAIAYIKARNQKFPS